MKKFKNVLVSILSIALVIVLSIGGTIAYLQDEDSDVNVMTMGNVKIEQLEYERVVDENGNWVSTGETDKYGYTPDKLQEFTQSKPLYPAVLADGVIKYDDRANGSHQQSWGQVGASGSLQLFDDSVKNVQDKFVFVKNTGKSDAYVRTWVALEQGSISSEDFSKVIRTNSDASSDGINEQGGNSHWFYNIYDTDVEIDGNKYVVVYYTYIGARGNNGVLKPGVVSYPSLTQVYMTPEATNEDVKNIDGNNNGTYDILVFSQAVQTKGFTDAKTALNTAFGTNHPWVDAKMSAPSVENGTMNLTGDIYVVDKPFYNEVDNTSSVTINGNGNTVHSTVTSENVFNWYPGTNGSRPTMGEMFSSTNGSKITINDLTFEGTTHTISLGKYKDPEYGNYDTELNNVNIIGLEVASYGPGYSDKVSGIGQAVIAFGKATFNNTNIYGTKRTGLETGPNWPLYDLAVVNHASATLNNSKVGTIYTWAKSSVIVNNSDVDTIYTAANKTYQGIVVNSGSNVKNIIAHANYPLLINVNAGATVDTIDLTIISNLDNCTINIVEGAKVNKIVTSDKTYTLEEWLKR